MSHKRAQRRAEAKVRRVVEALMPNPPQLTGRVFTIDRATMLTYDMDIKQALIDQLAKDIIKEQEKMFLETLKQVTDAN